MVFERLSEMSYKWNKNVVLTFIYTIHTFVIVNIYIRTFDITVKDIL